LADGPHQNASSRISAEPQQEKNLKILLVDDHEVVRRGLKTILTMRPSWTVCGEAGSGQDAIKRVRDLKPDLVLLDVTMPGMSGLEAATKIRNLAPSTKILILSMHDSASMTAEALRSGADAFLSKGTSATKLLDFIAGLFEGNG
jgi:DNA-binding NarL/FixJ family response regulator